MLSWAYWYTTLNMVSSLGGTSSVCWTYDFAHHFRKLFDDCPSVSWVWCGRWWTQGGEVTVTSVEVDARKSQEVAMFMRTILLCSFVKLHFSKRRSHLMIFWRQFHDYENHEQWRSGCDWLCCSQYVWPLMILPWFYDTVLEVLSHFHYSATLSGSI